MPLLALGLHIGDYDPDAITGPVVDGVLLTENSNRLVQEGFGFIEFDDGSGQILAFTSFGFSDTSDTQTELTANVRTFEGAERIKYFIREGNFSNPSDVASSGNVDTSGTPSQTMLAEGVLFSNNVSDPLTTSSSVLINRGQNYTLTYQPSLADGSSPGLSPVHIVSRA